MKQSYELEITCLVSFLVKIRAMELGIIYLLIKLGKGHALAAQQRWVCSANQDFLKISCQ